MIQQNGQFTQHDYPFDNGVRSNNHMKNGHSNSGEHSDSDLMRLGGDATNLMNKWSSGGLATCAKEAEQARAILEEQILNIGVISEEFIRAGNANLNAIRQIRFAFRQEAEQITLPLKEIAKYGAEIERLKELADVCERLEGLRQRGTLNVVTEALGKLP